MANRVRILYAESMETVVSIIIVIASRIASSPKLKLEIGVFVIIPSGGNIICRI